nr:MAG TPA: hypothetical protein [Caudoviricetes sp.]DAS10242.1 MAG TPA: hypothetical protein [Caudoviricetes sp.]
MFPGNVCCRGAAGGGLRAALRFQLSFLMML